MTHNGNSTLRQSYTQKTAYRWWRMAYFSHSARTAHGTPPKNQSGMDQKCVFPHILWDHLGCTNK